MNVTNIESSLFAIQFIYRGMELSINRKSIVKRENKVMEINGYNLEIDFQLMVLSLFTVPSVDNFEIYITHKRKTNLRVPFIQSISHFSFCHWNFYSMQCDSDHIKSFCNWYILYMTWNLLLKLEVYNECYPIYKACIYLCFVRHSVYIHALLKRKSYPS